MLYFPDANICIDLLRGKSEALEARLRGCRPSAVKIASMVKAELLLGGMKSDHPKKSLAHIRRFLEPFEVVPFGDRAAIHYARIRDYLERAGKKIGPNDLIIGSTVLASQGTLVTRNLSEFRRIQGLQLENWD
jgi:tRNA(fMet)-specific endonuclease VapC